MKKNNQILMILFLVFLTLTLSSCVLTSDNPLGSLESAIDDPTIKGIWRETSGKSEEDGGYLAISDGEQGYLQLLSFGNQGEGAVVFRGFVTEIGGDRYLNIQYVGDVGANMNFGKEYLLIHYSVSESGNLTMSPFSEGFFKKAIKENAIKGNVKKIKTSYGYTEGDVKIQASTDELVDFIKMRPKKEYLDEPNTFIKLHMEN